MSNPGFAQENENNDDNSEIQSVESELEKNDSNLILDQPNYDNIPKADAVDLQGLQATTSDKQIVIIQKNYMPKTGRFSLNGGLTLFPSDVLFKTFGAQLRGSYFFTEKWGVELTGILLSSAKSTELKDLEEKQGVSVANIATLKNYLGAQVYFSSMYGKYALNDRKIYPFELYQTIGLGQMTTDKGSSPAFSIGFGQMISMSRDSALRADLTLSLFQTENVSGAKQSQSSLLINLSYSSFIPSVGRRW